MVEAFQTERSDALRKERSSPPDSLAYLLRGPEIFTIEKMMLFSIPPLLLNGLLLLSFFIWLVLAWYRLHHIPGPVSASLSRYWLASRSMSGHLHLDLRKLHDRRGPLIRIGPNDVVTDDFTVVRRMHGSLAPYSRSDYYECGRLNPPSNNIISERHEGRHAELRSRMAAGVCRAAPSTSQRLTDVRDSIQEERTIGSKAQSMNNFLRYSA